MRRNAITAAVCLAAILTTTTAMGQTPPSPPRPQVQQDGVTWEVRYIVDTSQDPGGISQYDSPRSNRGVGVSPDGRYLYLGYNEPNGSPVAGRHDHQVRVIDTLVEDFTDSIVSILNRHRGKSITVDDRGRVYLAEGSDTDVHLGAGGIHIFDSTLGVEIAVIPNGAAYGLAKPEGVTVKREAGVLALYATDRSTKKLYRFVISENPTGFGITAITKAGLATGTGDIAIPGASDLRGVKVEPAGRIWMADLSGSKVFRCEADGSTCLVTPVAKAMDIGLFGQRAFVTQYTAPVSPTITVLRVSDMGFDSLLVAPWSGLKLDPLGQKQPVPNGPYLGNFAGTAFVRLPNGDKILYFSNERGQTEFEKSVYGRCDEFSDNPGGECVFTDTVVDDNEPVFRIFEPNRTIGDFVWSDLDGDGIQDAGEPGLENVTVTLNGPGGTQTTTTDENGMYLFEDLLEGTYTVTVETPAGYAPSPSTAPGGTPADDSNGSPTEVTLGPGSNSDLTIDFGFVPPATGAIGDFVWSDENGDGIQDAGEPGIGGVTVTLTGVGDPQTTTTDANGYYQFTNLTAGSYTVTVDTPPGTTPSPSSAAGSTTANDSNGSPATVTLATNSSTDQTIDFGFVPPAVGAIGDFVWNDVNGNGIQDAGEPGIAGVTVTLNGPGGVQTATTDATGFYQFNNLSAGSYTVTVPTPAGFSPTPSAAAGSTPANDSNGSPASVVLAINSSTDFTIDFGFVLLPTGSIGDFVWSDLNGNGIQDGGEPGIAGVTVTLTGPSGPQTTVTNASGFYQFTGLGAGSYTVSVATPAGTTPSPSFAAGSTSANDSNGSPATVTLATNASTDQTLDFGFVPPPTGSIGNFVWNDVNGNGIQDAGEPGLGGLTVTLSGPGGVQTTTTNASGFYLFTNLAAGTYTVGVPAPAGFAPTTSTAPGSTTANDSNGSPATVTLATNSSTDLTIDFGYWVIPTGRIGNFVWHDLNANGIQDSGEPGLANVTVQLKDSTGTVIRTTTTDANGYYEFTVLAAGSYTVVVSAPSGFVATTINAPGSTTANDSNGSPAAVTLPTSSSINLTIDFGYVKYATGYSTYTQGGWGAKPSGNNPGTLLKNNFVQVYSVGYVKVGGTKSLKFTSAKAIEVFLPQGGTPNVLKASATNPVGSAAGVFGGQVLALRLSVDFSAAGIKKVGLGSLTVISGPLSGYTVNQVLALANAVLGGSTSALPAGVTISKLNEVVDAINNNFDNGTTNNGYLR